MRPLLGTLIGLALLSPALAGDQAIDFTCEPVLENREEGARFQVTGKVPPGYPDGSNLHVTLMVDGRSRTPVRAAFMKVTVEKGEFGAAFTWPKQQLGPMVYKTQVVLYLNEQVPEVRKQLIQNFGWASDHIEKLGTIESEFGTAEERLGFGQVSLKELRSLVERYEVARQGSVTAVVAGDNAPALAALEELEKDLVLFKRKYVVRVEGELVQRLDSTNASLFLFTRRGARGKPNLERLKQETEALIAEIDARTALKPAGELENEGKPDEQKPEQEPGKEPR